MGKLSKGLAFLSAMTISASAVAQDKTAVNNDNNDFSDFECSIEEGVLSYSKESESRNYDLHPPSSIDNVETFVCSQDLTLGISDNNLVVSVGWEQMDESEAVIGPLNEEQKSDLAGKGIYSISSHLLFQDSYVIRFDDSIDMVDHSLNGNGSDLYFITEDGYLGHVEIGERDSGLRDIGESFSPNAKVITYDDSAVIVDDKIIVFPNKGKKMYEYGLEEKVKPENVTFDTGRDALYIDLGNKVIRMKDEHNINFVSDDDGRHGKNE